MPTPQTANLRIGIVPYLNMLPLVHGMDQLQLDGRRLEIAALPPSVMTRMMDAGELDIGMLPVGALADRPDWPIVGRSMIGSEGEVRSVLLAGSSPSTGWKVLHPDSQSRSSNLLARILLERFMGLDIRSAGPVPLEDDWTPPVSPPHDTAFVLIGSRALRWRYHWSRPTGETLDMGREWNRHTGLPFVFATWIARPGLDLEVAGIERWMTLLEDLKVRNMRKLPEIVATWPGLEFERQTLKEAIEYLHEIIRFDLDDRFRLGLRRFLDEARTLTPQASAPVPVDKS